MTQTPKALTLRDIFSPGGIISEHLRGYEFREEQLHMANAVARAFAASEHLIVEAGTGVGKSFAYLIPAVSLALKTDQTVVISTNTISLQEQLVTKDIPFLHSVLPRDFKAVLAKGRRNYLSRRRLESLLNYEQALFDTMEEVEQVQKIIEWVETTDDGSRADLPIQPMSNIWDKVASDRDNCLGRKCPTYDVCFYFKARNEMHEADLLIVNHHLLFSDLAIRQIDPSVGILPDYDYLIIDEAHHLEATATHHASLEISNTRIRWFLDSLHNQRNESGTATRFNSTDLIDAVDEAREQANLFFETIASYLADTDGYTTTKRIDENSVAEVFAKGNVLDIPLSHIEKTLKQLHDNATTDDDEQELSSYYNQCKRMREELDLMIRQPEPDYIYWIETSRWGRTSRILLNATPINVSQMLRENLFDVKESVVMTSATLATNRNFDYFKKRIGLNECRELLVHSPFNFKEQVKIHIPSPMPDPNSSEFIPAAIREIKHYLKLTHGKAFVLFTSYKMMDEIYEEVAPYLAEIGIDAFKQGGELSRTDMLQAFREDTNSVLFGTSSFWEGVDVRGEALSNVVITKLPFEVPTHPVMEARVKQIKEQGGNDFLEFSLPEAILRLKQGFGRLIRTQTDQGIVVILDSRIRTRSYGKLFLDSLPRCDIVA
ncbi:MAG: DEAD/DEAH box helicase family protein [Candidatus Poribacteria bacterium]|nr:DEAD/DEAH box helicase family protein [Candidatus Poribacteria bacterium]